MDSSEAASTVGGANRFGAEGTGGDGGAACSKTSYSPPYTPSARAPPPCRRVHILTAPGRRRPTHAAPRLPAQGMHLSPKKRAKKPSLDSPLSGPGRLCQPHLLSIFIAFLAAVGMGGGGAAALLFKGLPAAAALPLPPSPPPLQLGCDFEVDTCVWIDTAPDGYSWDAQERWHSIGIHRP